MYFGIHPLQKIIYYLIYYFKCREFIRNICTSKTVLFINSPPSPPTFNFLLHYTNFTFFLLKFVILNIYINYKYNLFIINIPKRNFLYYFYIIHFILYIYIILYYTFLYYTFTILFMLLSLFLCVFGFYFLL